MKKTEIAKRLEEKGYEVYYGKYEYWDSIPYVEHEDGKKTFLAKTSYAFGSLGVDMDLSFKKVLQAIEMKCRDINDLENKLRQQQIDKEVDEMLEKYN